MCEDNEFECIDCGGPLKAREPGFRRCASCNADNYDEDDLCLADFNNSLLNPPNNPIPRHE